MKHPPLLKSVMTPFPYTVEVDAALDEARELMRTHGFHHVPVTRGDAIVGILTGRHLVPPDDEPAQRPADEVVRVRDRYVRDAYIVDLNTRLDEVLLTMTRRRIGSAIVTRKGRLAGVFTWADACRAFGEHLRECFPVQDGDDAA